MKMMSHKIALIIFFIFVLIVNGLSQKYYFVESSILTLNNGLVSRQIILPSENQAKFKTRQFDLKDDEQGFLLKENREFQFEINQKKWDGNSDWKLIAVNNLTDETGGNGVEVILQPKNSENQFQIKVKYLLFPDLPIVKKSIGFDNIGNQEIAIESLDVENISNNFGTTHSLIYHNYGRNKTMNGYSGNYYDPVVILHDNSQWRGIVLGNEAPGVLKKTTVNLDGKTLAVGMNHSNEEAPFCKYLAAGEKWESPASFVGLYKNSSNASDHLNGMVADYVRKHLGARVYKLDQIPTSVYNTWAPFRGDMTTNSVIDVAKNAAECGFQYFVVDAGWNTIDGNATNTGDKDLDWILNLGDWVVDSTKFPNGLQEVFTEVEKLGMKPGLWISIATATKNARVFREHPDWFVKDKNGDFAFLHDESGNPNQATACLAGPYYDYIRDAIIKMVTELNLGYIKLDLSIVTSAYTFNAENTGCYATNHFHHKNHKDSYLAIYERCFQMFDEIHEKAPNLYIDCTFETMGKLQLIDFAMCKYAEGNWLSNIDDFAPKGSWRVRQLAWWRSPSIPAASLVIGNLRVDDPNYKQAMMSLSGNMPIMLGDTRVLSKETKRELKIWTNWMAEMEAKHGIMKFRQDLQGFGEPTWGSWDGFSRINTDTKSGGIVGVFRQDAVESSRLITVNNLEPNAIYQILKPDEKKLAKITGEKLGTEGFPVSSTEKIEGFLFEIKRVD